MSAPDSMAPGPRRFSIRLPRPFWIAVATVGVVVIGVLLVALRYHLQSVAIREIEQAGGRVVLRSRGPDWLRSWVGDERMKPYGEAIRVTLSYSRARDETLRHLSRLPNLQRLDFNGTNVTDAGLGYLGGLTNLEWLWLADTRVTDAGLSQLKKLTGLNELGLGGTLVTDAGLVHLKTMTGLRELWLNGTQITDAGLLNLKDLAHLERLFLRGTQVSDEGVSDLKRALPGLTIDR